MLGVVALFTHGCPHEARDSDTGRTGTRIENALVGYFATGNPDRAEDPRQRDCGGTLNIVVKARQSVPIAIQNGECDILVEVFPLQQRTGKDPFDALNKGLDELVISGSA